MGRITENLKELIDRGRKGENHALSMGLPKLERFVDGVAQETYYLIAGGTGSGKTSFALHSFIYKPIMENIDNPDFHIIYFSLEMTAEQLLGKILSIYIYETFGVELSFKELLSRSKDTTLSDMDYELVCQSLEMLDKIESHMIIYDKPLNNQRMVDFLMESLKQFGKFQGDTYTLFRPNHIILVILDHIGLARPSIGNTKKDEMDAMSSSLVSFRNKCKISPVVVMQVNRGSSNVERRKLNFQELQLDDLKGTGNPAEDANIVLALFYPFREKMSSYRGYDIKQIGENFRSAVVLKNRWGAADIAVGLGFYGKTGLFKELPIATKITNYDKYLTPDWLLTDSLEDSCQEITQEEQQDSSSKMTLVL